MGDRHAWNPGEYTSAERFAAAFQDKRTAIQSGQGLFATGFSVDEAAWRFIGLDKACHVQLLAEAAGTPQHWPEDMVRGLKRALGNAEFAWLSFQTLWDEFVAEGTGFLD